MHFISRENRSQVAPSAPAEKRWKSHHIHLILFICFSLYSTTWSIFVLLRYLSFNADVIDLGLASSTLYSMTHTPISGIVSNPGIIPWNKLMAVPLSAIFYLFPYEGWLPVFQTIWIGVGVFPLYEIGKEQTGDWKISLIMSVSYLLYYPMSGVNWFDFHFMSLFPTAFLLSFYYHIRGRDGIAIAFAAVGIFSDYLAPFLFSFLVIYLVLARREYLGRYAASILSMTVAVIILVTIFYGTSYTLSFTHLSGSSFSETYVAPMSKKILYIVYMLLPLLFVSLLGLDFLLVGLPFFLLVSINSYQPYLSTMFYQYPALIAPIIFISALVGMKRLPAVMKRIHLRGTRIRRHVITVATAILILNILLFSFESPVGEEFTHSVDSNLANGIITGSYYSYYTPERICMGPWDSYLRSALESIPPGSSVLIQNNMPQEVLGYNWSLPDSMPTGFIPCYIVVDPYSIFYNNYSEYPHRDNFTMMTAASYFLSTGNYGISLWEDSIVILTYHYSGTVKFIPSSRCISLHSVSDGIHCNGECTVLPFVVPGTYELKLPAGSIPGTVCVLNRSETHAVGSVRYLGNQFYLWTVVHFHGRVHLILRSSSHDERIDLEAIEP